MLLQRIVGGCLSIMMNLLKKRMECKRTYFCYDMFDEDDRHLLLTCKKQRQYENKCDFEQRFKMSF